MTDTTRPVRPGHTGLVGLPLFLTMLFCFAFVLVQAHQTDSVQSAAGTSDNVSNKTSIGLRAKPKSKVSSHTKSALKTSGTGDSSTASPVNPSSGDSSPETTTPQPDDTTAKKLQSAVPTSQTGNLLLKAADQTGKTLESTGNKLDQLLH